MRTFPEIDCMQHRTRCNESGFTLIELLIVMVILGLLAGMIVPRIMDRPEEARRVKAGVQIKSLETALRMYRLDNGAYPDTDQGLEALVALPKSGREPMRWRKGGYLEQGKIPKDPWGNDFIYLSPGQHGDFDIISYGADGKAGGDGNDADINSWELE